MNFDLSDDQRLLQDSVARLVREHSDFASWRERVACGAGFDCALWSKMSELGWLSLTAPEDAGGYGGTPVDTMVIMEGVGRGLMLEPFVGSGVIAPAVLPRLDAMERGAILNSVMAGEAVVCLADAEPEGRFDLRAIATRAEHGAGGFRLWGEKSHALDGAHGDWFIVPARTSGRSGDRAGITLFLIPKDAPGLTIEPFRAMDHRRNASLVLSGVPVPAARVLGGLDEGFDLLQWAVDLAIAARLAEAVGAMEAAYEQTLQYLKTRRQFGQPIGGFQALQHRIVDMGVACEEARSMMYLATLSFGAPAEERRRMVTAAKARVGQTGLFVGRQAVQLHGGIGFSDELAVGHYLKRLIMIDLSFGNAAEQRRQFAALQAA